MPLILGIAVGLTNYETRTNRSDGNAEGKKNNGQANCKSEQRSRSVEKLQGRKEKRIEKTSRTQSRKLTVVSVAVIRSTGRVHSV